MKRSDQKTDTSESSLPPATEAVFQITCVDVLTRGGGQGTQNHCGNVTYRKLVNLNKVRIMRTLLYSCLDLIAKWN